MFEFRKIQLSDKNKINACLKISDFRGCEYCFANNLAWNRLADTQISFYDDFYISCSFYDGMPYITFPSGVTTDTEQGRKKYIELFSSLKNYMISKNHSLNISSVSSKDLQWLSEYYGGEISVHADRDSFDYIYNTEDLIELKGRKYHGKRNHIKRFKEKEWLFRPLEKTDFDECTTFAAEFYNNSDENDFSSAVEQYAIYTYFRYFDTLGLKGGMLYSEGKLVGFTIGEPLNSDTFDVHIEKAVSGVQGAYATLCNEFAKYAAKDFKYINREEDLGLEGLRKSKLSYKPAFLHEKYTLTFL